MRRRPWFVVSAHMLSHCVYVWKKSNADNPDTVMYVGSSMLGVRRLANHQTLPMTYNDDDYIEFYPCESRYEMRTLERELITQLRPQLNKQMMPFLDD